MAAEIPKDRTIAALGEVWASIDALLVTLSTEEWSASTPLPGWDVHDTVAHIVGTERMLLGESPPEVEIDRDALPHVRNDAGAFNEVWIESMRSMPHDELASSFQDATARRLAILGAMSQDEWDAESFTPAGRGTYGRFMQIRVFDCWLHEQDIRDAIDRPGHDSGLAVEVTLDELTTAMGFVVGKKAAVPQGESVTFALTDGGTVVREIHVEVGDRAHVVPALEDGASCALTMPVGVMTRLGAGRITPDKVRDQVAVTGDEALGEAVLTNLAYTI